jgi:hypothetical protein
VKKEILIIPLIICEHDPTIAAVENNPAAHHLGTPDIMNIVYG